MSQPLFTGQRNQIDPRDFLTRLGPAPRIGVVAGRAAAAVSQYNAVEIQVGSQPVYIIHLAVGIIQAQSYSLHLGQTSGSNLDGLSSAATAFTYGIGPALTATATFGRSTTQPNGLIVASQSGVANASVGLYYPNVELPLYVPSGFVAAIVDVANVQIPISMTWVEVPT